jgi:hypothetical protein
MTNLNDINAFGEIVGGGFDPRTGRGPAIIAIPTGKYISLRDVGARSHRIVLPERIRALLKRRLHGHF